ncbi:MAG: imidazole glycerol phosphate synthase subunit HisF [Bacillota bacterium]
MLKTRLIPVLILKNGILVRSESFKFHQSIGNPIHEVERFNEWNVDELIYLDISDNNSNTSERMDSKIKKLGDSLNILEKVSKTCFMPLTWGGNIKTINDMEKRFQKGADKISINSAAMYNPGLIHEAACNFGTQAIVVSIDVFADVNGKREVFINGGKSSTGKDPIEWAKEVEKLGAGEILLQSINNDGRGEGYDLDLIEEVSKTVNIPVIACSGVGEYKDFVKGVEAGASAVAAANIFHFKEMSDRYAKRVMKNAGINVRKIK